MLADRSAQGGRSAQEESRRAQINGSFPGGEALWVIIVAKNYVCEGSEALAYYYFSQGQT